ncbi:uncharacterized protein V1513DRAFT_463212 [Lipomyces chichibuensis]|uniref:uncharacterized protein n=1 Tax=Lipomyces chichibuensis TaxID=1546026 RepID=UPI003343FFD9
MRDAGMDYISTASWFMFLVVFIVMGLYATRKRWELLAREHIPIYNRLVPLTTHLRGRAGAGYLPGNATTGVLPLGTLLPISNQPPSSVSQAPGTFQQDAASGLTSDTFDLRSNVANGDGRGGLSDDSKAEVQAIMREMHVGFDEARALYTRRVMERNGIGADGRPRDPRAVFFS